MDELTNYELIDLCIKCCTYLSKFGEDIGIDRTLKDILKEMEKRGLKK